MRDGIVHVEQIKTLRFSHFHHLYGERKRVRRVVKQGIAGNLHFVELDSIVGVGEANWRCIADEMDLMATRSQLHSQLGRDDARTAIRRVASDPNLHIVPSVPLVLLPLSAGWEALDFL